jgi:hypothetical protein
VCGGFVKGQVCEGRKAWWGGAGGGGVTLCSDSPLSTFFPRTHHMRLYFPRARRFLPWCMRVLLHGSDSPGCLACQFVAATRDVVHNESTKATQSESTCANYPKASAVR